MIELPTLNGRRFVRGWARTLRGQRMLEELLDFGYLLDPPSVCGGAVDFIPASSQSLRRGDDASLDVANSTSVMLQGLAVSDEGTGSNRALAGKRASTGAANKGYHLLKDTAGDMKFSVSDGVDQVNSNTFSVDAANWHVWSGYLQANAAADDDLGLYQDATAATEINSTVLSDLENAVGFAVASNAAGGGLLWDGRVAYARVWKKSGAWTQAELDRFVEARRRLYLPAGWAPGGTMELQWILWDLDARDYSGNGLTGTYYNSPTVAADPAGYMGPGGSPRKLGRAAAVVVRHRRMLMGVGR